MLDDRSLPFYFLFVFVHLLILYYNEVTSGIVHIFAVYQCLFVCIWFPANTGSNPPCHKSRGDDITDWTQSPRDQNMVKKLAKNLWGLMWVSNQTLVTNCYVSVTVGVCICCGRRTGAPGERTTAGLLGIQTEPIQTWSRLSKASETSGVLSQVSDALNEILRN